MSSSAGETFAGFTVLVLLSAVICAPALGWSGILAAFAAIYFHALHGWGIKWWPQTEALESCSATIAASASRGSVKASDRTLDWTHRRWESLHGVT